MTFYLRRQPRCTGSCSEDGIYHGAYIPASSTSMAVVCYQKPPKVKKNAVRRIEVLAQGYSLGPSVLPRPSTIKLKWRGDLTLLGAHPGAVTARTDADDTTPTRVVCLRGSRGTADFPDSPIPGISTVEYYLRSELPNFLMAFLHLISNYCALPSVCVCVFSRTQLRWKVLKGLLARRRSHRVKFNCKYHKYIFQRKSSD